MTDARGRGRSDARVQSALAAAEQFLSLRGAQFTPIRRAVLRLLCRAGKAVGAYELLYSHQQEVGHRVAPNTIYRALIFLEQHRLVAHLAGQRRYVAITPHTDRGVLFFVCDGCGISLEHDATHVERALNEAAAAIGFRAVQRSLAVAGTCRHCAARVKALKGA